MDSLTQIALGASLSAACASPKNRRVAVIAGAALGTLPDLDVLIRYDDPVDNFIRHRGFSHSIFVLCPFALLIWAIAKKYIVRVGDDPRRWFWSIFLALVTHPLLDAHTVYGTQILWPMGLPPTMWSTIFIIDPAYTLPLLVGAVAALTVPRANTTRRLITFGIVLSSCYLIWSWAAKCLVNTKVSQYLETTYPHESAQTYFTVPTPFNTLLWRIIIKSEDQYAEGYLSVRNLNQPLEFRITELDQDAVSHARQYQAFGKLDWFTHGFMKTEMSDNKLFVSDLRMGAEPHYVFRYLIAAKTNAEWQEVTPIKQGSRYSWEQLKKILEKI